MTDSYMAGGDWLDLGEGLRGFYARPAGDGPWPAVVIFIEAFGVNDHFRRLAARFAEAGYCALVPDIYHGDVFSYDDMENAISRLREMNDDTIIAETGRALDALAARPEVRGGGVA
ncbi:MAG: dienelactone hydrolase family protein, partial [Alphaproteobacteria bacterium]